MTETATRDIPQPGYKILKKTFETHQDNTETHQWLVQLGNKRNIRLAPSTQDGKVKPPQYGNTEHVTVTTNFVDLGENGVWSQTNVYATDENETFYDALVYAAPGILVNPSEVDETMKFVMFAIGEV